MPARSSTPFDAVSARLARSSRRRSPRSTTSDLNSFSFVDAGPRVGRRRAGRCLTALRRRAGRREGARAGCGLAATPKRRSSIAIASRRRPAPWCERLLGAGGAVPVGLTTASEFGGLNVSVTKLNGVTHNPWRHGRTVGGSSAGSAAAVAGGLVSLATGGDGGGSIRIPAGYTGLLGMKGTYGRIPRGPDAYFRPGNGRARLPRPVRARRGALLRRVCRVRLARPVESPGAARLGVGSRYERPRRTARRIRAGARRRDARAGHRGRTCASRPTR